MNSISQLVDRHYPGATVSQRRHITLMGVGYVLNVMTSREFTYEVRNVLEQNVNVIDLRRDLQIGYYMRNVKLWLWYCWTNKVPREKSYNIMKHFGVEEHDKILYRIMRYNEFHHAELNKLSLKYKSHKPAVYDKHITETLSSLHGYTHRFIWAKLRFLTMGSETTVDDLFMELQYYALYAMMKQYPKVDDKLHLVNIAKRAIHNFGINLIHHHTTQGRAVWDYNEEGQATNLVKSSYDMMFDSAAYEDSVVSSINGSEEPYADEQDKLDNSISVSKVLDQHKGKRRKFLELLTGTYDPKFSGFLHKQGLKDNDELFDSLSKRDKLDHYIDHASRFLGVSTYKTHVFLNEVRSQL